MQVTTLNNHSCGGKMSAGGLLVGRKWCIVCCFHWKQMHKLSGIVVQHIRSLLTCWFLRYKIAIILPSRRCLCDRSILSSLEKASSLHLNGICWIHTVKFAFCFEYYTGIIFQYWNIFSNGSFCFQNKYTYNPQSVE